MSRLAPRTAARGDRLQAGSLVSSALVLEGRVHHVGLTVSDLDAALRFWEGFLGVERRWETVLERPYIARHVGYPGVRIRASFVDLPGGSVLELLEYLEVERGPLDEGSANPGHAHLCLAVDDVQGAFDRALEHGARPVHPPGPVEVEAGPNKGARVSYLRVPPDWHTVELLQPPS
jgi:catechol 2,3-dioxygenase-like lactoylglutathione lyase family enzyme